MHDAHEPQLPVDVDHGAHARRTRTSGGGHPGPSRPSAWSAGGGTSASPPRVRPAGRRARRRDVRRGTRDRPRSSRSRRAAGRAALARPAPRARHGRPAAARRSPSASGGRPTSSPPTPTRCRPGAARRASMPSSVRTTCVITVAEALTDLDRGASAPRRPGRPRSGESVTRAWWKSSNPSLYPMFLKPTANPTPRRSPSPWPTLPAPPGRVTGSRTGRVGRRRHRDRRAGIDHLAHRRAPVQHLAGRQHGTRPERVPSPQLEGIDPEHRGELVHLGLVGERHLRRAEPAHRAAGRVVRVDRRPLQQGVRHLVRSGRERRRVPDHGGRGRRVRAAVDQHAGTDVHEPPVCEAP